MSEAEAGKVQENEAKEVLFFELESVAANGRPLMFETVKAVLKTKNIAVTPVSFSRYAHAPRPAAVIEGLIEESGKNITTGDKAAADAETKLVAKLKEVKELNKTLAGLIKEAQARDIEIVALSAWPKAVAETVFKNLGFDKLGAELIIFETKEEKFPRADHWLRILKEHGKDKQPLIAVVSSYVACKGALTADAACIVLPDAYTFYQDFPGAKVVLDGEADLPPKEVLDLVCRR